MVVNMIKMIKIYLKIQFYNIKAIKTYKIDFILGCFSFALNQMITLASLYVLYRFNINIGDWSFYEIMFLQGYVSLIISFSDFLSDSLWDFTGTIISRGNFDKYMTKPISSLLLILVDRIQIDAIGGVFSAMIMLYLSCFYGNISINIIYFIFYLFSSLLIVLSIKIICSSFAFKLKRCRALLFIIFKMMDFCKYPLLIYPLFIRIILTVIIPFGLCSYYPVDSLLGNKPFSPFVFLLIGFVLICLSFYIWNIYENEYSGSGT